jgi:hypothetical protein
LVVLSVESFVMCRLRCGSALCRLARSCVFALMLGGCAATIDGTPQPPAIGPTELLGTGGHAQEARLGREPQHLTRAEQELIMARAIAAHEMRYP